MLVKRPYVRRCAISHRFFIVIVMDFKVEASAMSVLKTVDQASPLLPLPHPPEYTRCRCTRPSEQMPERQPW